MQKILLHLSLLTSLIVIIWHKTLSQGLWGDGFYWFNPLLRSYHIFPLDLAHPVYNSLSREIFNIIIPLFQDSQTSYQLFQIILLILLTVAIYFAVLKLTAKTTLAFVSCIVFVSNYGGMYEMIAEGNLNRFLERVPNLIIVILGVYFLASFLQTKKPTHLFLSWLLFTVGLYLGHFASFILPFFLFFPVIYLFTLKKPIKSLTIGLAIALLFGISNFIIIRNSDQRSGLPLSFYLDPNQKFIEKTFLMTTPLIVPREIVINLAPTFSIRNPYLPLVRIYTIALIPISIAIGSWLYRHDKKLAKLYLACILSILGGTALMIYTDPVKYDPYKNFGAGRHMFIQSIFYAIALTSVIITFLQKHNKIFFPALFLFLTIFVVYNTNLSWRDIAAYQYLYEGNRKFFTYIKTLYPKFNSNTVVVLGSTLMHASSFLTVNYGPPFVNYISAPEDIQKFVPQDKSNVYLIDINYNPTPDGYYLPERVKIDDFTNLFRTTDVNLAETWGTQKVTWFESLNTQK